MLRLMKAHDVLVNGVFMDQSSDDKKKGRRWDLSRQLRSLVLGWMTTVGKHGALGESHVCGNPSPGQCN